ncbi:MAG TPA: aminodeoxychorismate/anthranilate synthase component II [Flavobacteriales bacterium]|nr:aminodeoxychorismate/anthranilate synthase component II [Flavobacteriales bacterium]
MVFTCAVFMELVSGAYSVDILQPNKRRIKNVDDMNFIPLKNRFLEGMQKLLVVDNFDSFTYNLIHLVEMIGVDFEVRRNSNLGQLDLDLFSHLIIGPGPGLPSESGDLMKLLDSWPISKPILGVCLGMQAMLQREGGELQNLSPVFHGAQSDVFQRKIGVGIFKELPQSFKVGRYHSWGFSAKAVPNSYQTIVTDAEDLVMAVKHTGLDWYGVQFHPESIMTEHGLKLLTAFVQTKSQ